MDQRIHILFVCHGNICRSPMAEFVLKHMVERRFCSQSFHIESAATSSEELGNPVHSGTSSRLAREGISCAGKRARRLQPSDYDTFDLLVGMDDANVANMKRICHGDPDGKIFKLLSFANVDRNVADPWYTGDFDKAYDDIAFGCEALLRSLLV